MEDQKVPEVYDNQLEKAKKNLVYVGIFSVIMLFAGLTSAYIVSMGSSFWLKASLPNAFWISTAVIFLSSIAMQMAVSGAVQRNQARLRSGIIATLILGLGFVYFQFKGYNQLVENGIHAVGNIFVSDGKYGDYFEVKMDGQFVEVNGNDYLLSHKKLTAEEMESLQQFMSQFLKADPSTSFEINNYGKKFQLYFQNRPLVLVDGELMLEDSVKLEYLDRLRLSYLAGNIQAGRGDFFARGEIGKDFHVYYQGEEVTYKDRDFYLKGKKLSNYLQIKAMEAADRSSSYLYLITFLHLLHILITLLYVVKLVIGSFSDEITQEKVISVKMGAIFWHFLGLLWVYLLLFLLFIH